VARSRHARRVHHLLAERLRALKSRTRCGRPEARDRGLRERVGETRHERDLWANDDEADVLVTGRGGQALNVVGRHRQHSGVRGDAGVARSTEQVGFVRGTLQRVDDRVLASAATDDQHATGEGH
jgi:hypothetical protein